MTDPTTALREALEDCVGMLKTLVGSEANSEGAIDEQIAEARAALASTSPVTDWEREYHALAKRRDKLLEATGHDSLVALRCDYLRLRALHEFGATPQPLSLVPAQEQGK